MNTFKSIAANFDTKKATEALQAYNIELYTTNENGMKVMRDGANIFGELQNLFTKLDDEGKRKLAMSISGGKFQVNALQSFLADANQNFSKIMDEMKNKSSDEMTQQLLAVSMETYQTKIAQLKASLQVLAQTIGNQVLPYLKQFAVYLIGTSMYLQQHSTMVMNVGKALLYMAGAYIAVKVAAFTYSAITGTIAIGMAVLTASVGLATKGTWAFQLANVAATISSIAMAVAAAAQAAIVGDLARAWKLLTVAMAANPIGLILIAITALGVAAYALYVNWDTSIKLMKDSWNGLINYIAEQAEHCQLIFVVIGGALVVLSALNRATTVALEGAWNQFTSFFNACYTIIGSIINSICEAVPNLVTAFGNALNNITSILNNWLGTALGPWGSSVISFFNALGVKLDAVTKNIGNTIRNNLLPTGGGMGDFKRSEEPKEPEETPFQKAQRLWKANYDKMVADMKLPEMAATEPTIGNQIPEGGEKGKKGAKGTGETEYQQAKKSFEEANAQAQYDTESSGKQYTSNDKLYLYKAYLDGVTKLDDAHHQETLDYEKGEYDLKTKTLKESLQLQKAELDKNIAEERLTKRQAFEEEIGLLQKEVNTTLDGSVERVKAETAVINKKREYENHIASIAKKESEINHQYLTDMQLLIDKQMEFNEKLKLVNPQQMTVYKNQQNESTFADKNTQNESAIGKTATTGNESAMVEKYRQYQQAKTQIERDELAKQMIDISQANTKTLEMLAKGEQDWATYEKKKQELSQETYEYTNRYQIDFINTYESSIAEAINNTLNKTKSFADNIRSIFTSLWKTIANQFSQDFAKKWTTSLSQLVLGSKQSTNEVESFGQRLTTSLNQEMQKQLTGQTQFNQQKTTLNTTSDATIQQSAANTTTSVLGDLSSMLTQMLSTMAIMYVLSALFGGGGSSTSTSSVSLGRSASSYYTTPAAVSQITVPSFDVGAQQLPEDMLAMVHKNEMILEPGLASNIRSLGTSDNSTSNSTNVTVKSNFSPNLIDSRGINQVYKQTTRELSKGVAKAYRNGSLSSKLATT